MQKLFILFPTILLVLSCGNKEQQKNAAAMSANQVKDYKVLTLTIRPKTIVFNDFPASIEGQQNIEIRPKIDGYIDKIYVDEGSIVKKGQLLFSINAPQYQQEVLTANASIKSAEADVNTALLAVKKVRPLVEKEIISKFELESAEYNYQAKLALLSQAKASLANAKTNLSYTQVTSPVNGIIGSIPYRLGSLVSSNTAEPLTTVASTGNVFAYFSLNEKILLNIFKNDSNQSQSEMINKLPPVNLLLADGSLYDKPGKIETINGIINTQTGSANLRAVFPNPNGLIRSGSSATVRISKEITNAIVIPQSATYELQDKRFVVILDKDNKSRAEAITISPQSAGNFFIVENGLKTGDKIVLEGVNTIKNDTPIKPVEVDPKTVYADLK